jgi:hypothetical protein
MTTQYILSQLDALRKSTLGTDGTRQGSFSVLFHSFLDIAEDPDLLKASKPTKDKTIKGAIESCARNITGDNALSIQGLRMLRIDSVGFIHGSFFAGASVGTFFYFEKERQGLVAFAQGGGVTRFTRLTLVDLPAGAFPVSAPPSGSQRS